jgi:Protein of unknown function (DUF2786)
MTNDQNKSPPNNKLLERLKKLFALGQSSNQHEAELATQKASEIMAEHQIAMSEIDLLDDGEITKEDHFMPEGARMANWVLRLASAAAILYDSKCHRGVGEGDGEKEIALSLGGARRSCSHRGHPTDGHPKTILKPVEFWLFKTLGPLARSVL